MLLDLHEVRLAMQLMEEWSMLPFAASSLAGSLEDFRMCIESFVRRQWSVRSTGGDAGLAMLQGYGDSHSFAQTATSNFHSERPTSNSHSERPTSNFHSEREEESSAKRAGFRLHTMEKHREVAAAREAAETKMQAQQTTKTSHAAEETLSVRVENTNVENGTSGDEVPKSERRPSRSSTSVSRTPNRQAPESPTGSFQTPPPKASPIERPVSPKITATLAAAGDKLTEMLADAANGADVESVEKEHLVVQEPSEPVSGEATPDDNQISSFKMVDSRDTINPAINSSPVAPKVDVSDAISSSPVAPGISREVSAPLPPLDCPPALGLRLESSDSEALTTLHLRGYGPAHNGPAHNGGSLDIDTAHNGLTLPGAASVYPAHFGHSLSIGSNRGYSLHPIHHQSIKSQPLQGLEYTNIMMAPSPSQQMGMHASSTTRSADISTGSAPLADSTKSSNFQGAVKDVIQSCRVSLQPALTSALKADDRNKTSRSLNELWMGVPSHGLLIHPSGPFRMSWDMVALVFIIYESVVVPLSMAFEVQPPDWSQWILTAYFAADCILNFFTGYFVDGTLVMKQDMILWHYARTWMVLDLVATFPWFALSNFSGTLLRWLKVGRILRMLRLLRLAKLNHLMQQIEDIFYTTNLVVVVKLLKIICGITLFCHWCACVWAWLGGPDHYDENDRPYDRSKCEPGGPCEGGITGSPWRRRYGLESEPVIFQYLISLRFATGLFTGSDIGIQPGWHAERLFVILTMFMSFIALSSAISRVVVMFNKISQEHAEQEDIMMSFKEFMAAGQVPLSLQSKVKRYLEYQFHTRRDLRVRHFDLLEKLSPWLRTELQAHVNKNILIQHPLFKSMPRDLLAQCCCVAEAMLAAPDDVVTQKGQVCNSMYFLVRGKLHVSSEEAVMPQRSEAPKKLSARRNSDNTEQFKKYRGIVMKAPGFVGASCLFREHPLTYTVTADTHSELLKLSKDELDTLREEFPALRSVMETFYQEATSTGEGLVDCSLRILNEQAGEWTLW